MQHRFKCLTRFPADFNYELMSLLALGKWVSSDLLVAGSIPAQSTSLKMTWLNSAFTLCPAFVLT